MEMERFTREPKPGEVWRERRSAYAKRTVVVLDEIDGFYANRPDRFVRVRTLTDDHGKPVEQARATKIKVSNWHKVFEFDREKS